MPLSNHLIMIEEIEVGEYFDWLGVAYKKIEPEGLLKDGANCVRMRYPSKKELNKIYMNPWQMVRLIPTENWGDPLEGSPTINDGVKGDYVSVPTFNNWVSGMPMNVSGSIATGMMPDSDWVPDSGPIPQLPVDPLIPIGT